MSLAEVIAVILGVVYLVLAVRRSRWCWVAGGISSAIVIWLSAQRALPMQAGLNVYYVDRVGLRLLALDRCGQFRARR